MVMCNYITYTNRAFNLNQVPIFPITREHTRSAKRLGNSIHVEGHTHGVQSVETIRFLRGSKVLGVKLRPRSYVIRVGIVFDWGKAISSFPSLIASFTPVRHDSRSNIQYTLIRNTSVWSKFSSGRASKWNKSRIHSPSLSGAHSITGHVKRS